MLKIYRFLFLLLLFPFFASAATQFRVRVKFSSIANLTYQLDCVGELPINCSQGNLNELWKREFLKSDEDRKMLAEWKRLRELYSAQRATRHLPIFILLLPKMQTAPES
jgi:hypothetical protein